MYARNAEGFGANLPKVLHIGAATYDVKPKGRHFDLLGETDDNNTVIKIRTKNQSIACQRDTLLHEAMHAIFWCSGMKNNEGFSSDAEERIIRVLAPWLLALLRDNPDLLAFLLEN